MGKGRNLGRKFGTIVIGGDTADQLTAHEAKARRRAERAIAIGRVEFGTARSQGINIWCFYHLVAIGAGKLWRELIGHDQDDIGLFAGHGPSSSLFDAIACDLPEV